MATEMETAGGVVGEGRCSTELIQQQRIIQRISIPHALDNRVSFVAFYGSQHYYFIIAIVAS